MMKVLILDESITLDDGLIRTLNELARLFYKDQGYEVAEGFDFNLKFGLE